MSSCADLLARAQRSPHNFRFTDLIALAECHGWRFSRRRGSHVLLHRPGTPQLLNFQNESGKAKAYQVRQLLAAIASLANE